MDAEKMLGRIGEIVHRLKDTQFTKHNPLQAADLDLERKVLTNERRRLAGLPREYKALYY